jgi:hypothetical protein
MTGESGSGGPERDNVVQGRALQVGGFQQAAAAAAATAGSSQACRLPLSRRQLLRVPVGFRYSREY